MPSLLHFVSLLPHFASLLS